MLGFSHLLDGIDDVRISPASANVAAHGLLDIGVVRANRLLHEGDRRHDLTRRAVTTLEAVVVHKCRLHRMHLLGRPESLNGRYFVTLSGETYMTTV